MPSFRARWRVDTDNLRWYENIIATGGHFDTLTPEPYRNYLNEFAIFYTETRPFSLEEKGQR